jgi:hypothetical protein
MIVGCQCYFRGDQGRIFRKIHPPGGRISVYVNWAEKYEKGEERKEKKGERIKITDKRAKMS